MSTDLNALWQSIEEAAVVLAKKAFASYAGQAESDTRAFLKASERQVRDWSAELASGQLSREDFKFLLDGLKELATLHALKEAGLAEVKLAQFRSDLVKTIFDKVIAIL
ncbi:MAG: hypothetical protein PVI37_00410 [Gammaproteobacteria bacterium]|jgi:hypothetical protein